MSKIIMLLAALALTTAPLSDAWAAGKGKSSSSSSTKAKAKKK